MTRHDVAWLYRQANARGLIVGSSGNVSGRLPDGMLITPSGGDPEDDVALAEIDMGGSERAGPTPSSEWALHAVVYRECPDAGFVLHAHSDAATALACLNEGLPAFHYMVLQLGGSDVRCAPYVTFGTPALADAAAEAIRGRSACLLANHGMIVCGKTASATLARAQLLESLCRQYLMARAVGTPRLLTAQEMADARERFKSYGPRHSRPS